MDIENALARLVEFPEGNPIQQGERIPRSPPEAGGVSGLTAIKWIHSLHFEDSLSAAGGLQGASIAKLGTRSKGGSPKDNFGF